jgi:hypothetical protein
MFYVKNIPNWERILRIVVGIMGLVFAAMNWGTSNLAAGAGIAGAILSMTGLAGFVPCARWWDANSLKKDIESWGTA